LNIGTI
jgi:hypothetical protein